MDALRWDPGRVAVLVVDAQNDFCHPDGLQAVQGRDVERVQAPLQRLVGFVDAARDVGVPIIFVRNVHGPSSDTPQWLARHSDSDRAQSCQEGSWGAEFCGVAPQEGEVVASKTRYSAFTNLELAQRLRELGRDSLLFTGFTTNVCVESSLREAVCRDFLATLVEDCCGAYTADAHARAIQAVHAGFGVVASSADVVDAWKTSALTNIVTPSKQDVTT